MRKEQPWTGETKALTRWQREEGEEKNGSQGKPNHVDGKRVGQNVTWGDSGCDRLQIPENQISGDGFGDPVQVPGGGLLENVLLFLPAFLIQLLTEGAYWGCSDLPLQRVGYAAVDAAGKSFTSVLALQVLEKIWNRRPTPAFVLAFSTLLYNQNSILKFSVDQLFPGFLRNSRERLIGGILVDAAILSGICTLDLVQRAREQRRKNRYRERYKEQHCGITREHFLSPCREHNSGLWNDLFSRQVFIRLALAAAALFAGIRIASLVLTGKPISQVTGRTMHTVWEGLTDLLYLFCALAWEAGSNAEAGYQEGKDTGTRGSLDRGREKGYRRDRAKRDRKRRRKEGSGREGRDGESSSIPSGEGIGDAGTGRTVTGEVNDREGRCPGRTIRERKIRGRKIKARQVRESSIKGRYPRGRRPEGDAKAGKPTGCSPSIPSSLSQIRKLCFTPSHLPLLIVGAVQAITTLCTGSKQALTGFALYCLLAFLVAGRISMRQLSLLLVLSPLLLCLVTGVSEHTSGRLSGYPTRFVMQYHAFRYDLSDLAITIAERETEDPERGLEEGLKVVREALEMAVPSVLSGGYGKESGKPTELDAYRNQLSGIGLYPDADDYNDTFFSMGAQLLGYPGIFLVFAGILILYDVMGEVCTGAIAWTSKTANPSGRRESARRTTKAHLAGREVETHSEGWREQEYAKMAESAKSSAQGRRISRGRESGADQRAKTKADRQAEADRQENADGGGERKDSAVQLAALLLEIPYSMQAEGDWFMWIYRTRDFAIEMPVILLALYLILRIGYRKERKAQ